MAVKRVEKVTSVPYIFITREEKKEMRRALLEVDLKDMKVDILSARKMWR